MPSCPVHMEETLVSVPRPSIGSVMPPKNRFHRLIPYGLGHGHGWPLCERSVAGPAFLMAHNLSGNARGLQGSEELSPRSQRSPCPIRSGNMSVVSYLNHQGGLRSRPLCRLAHQILLWSKGKLSSLRTMYAPGDPNQGAEAGGMETTCVGGRREASYSLPCQSIEYLWRLGGPPHIL